MKMLFAFVCLLTLLSATSPPPRTMGLFIVGGSVATADQYPFIASLQMVGFGHFCGASILRKESPAIILTAAHCAESMDTSSNFYVRLNADDALGSNGDYVDSAITHILLHPEWSGVWYPPYKNDIALLWLSEDISSNSNLETVTVTPLLSKSDECCSAGEPLQLIGYGSDVEGGNLTDTLEFLDLTYVDQSTCNALYAPTNWTIYDGMNCAAAAQAGSCHGDSGGPLLRIGTNEQVGIVSWGIGCADAVGTAQTPGVYNEVGSYMQWIEEHWQTTPEPTTPSPTQEFTVPICNAYDAENDEIIGEIACGSSVSATHSNSGNSVIYKFTVSSGCKVISADTCGSTFDTGLGIHDLNGDLIDANCNDDGECGLQSSITQTLEAETSTEYWLKIGGYNGATGDYVLNLQCSNCNTTTQEPTTSTSTPQSECDHNNGIPMDICISLDAHSFQYSCINETAMETKYYVGATCNENSVIFTGQERCLAENNCVCSSGEDSECDISEATITQCESGTVIEHPFVTDVCLFEGENSTSYHCNENGEFVQQFYDNSHCESSEFSSELIHPSTCESGETTAVTCTTSEPSDGICCECTDISSGAECTADEACESVICELDPFCCDTQWDRICANDANAMCDNPVTSSPTASPVASGICCACTDTSADPGCAADLDCQTAICALDSFCCSNQWDSICANDASALCQNLTTPFPTVSPTDSPTEEIFPNPITSEEEATLPICNAYDAENDEIIGEITCGSTVSGTHSNGGNSVIYKFTVSGSQCSISADTCGSTFDTGLGIHDSNGDLIDENCNDDSICGLQSSITQILPSETSTEYWLKLGGYYGATGDYVLSLQCNNCGGTAPQALECPNGDEPILVAALNDIAGCGLDASCADRYNKETIEECRIYCESNPDCVSYSWTPPSGDVNHPGEKVCTIYDSAIPNQEWGPNQIMCALTSSEWFPVVAWNTHHQNVGYEGNFFGAYHTDVMNSDIANNDFIFINGQTAIVNFFGQSNGQPETGARIDYIYAYDIFGNQANFKNIFGGNGVTTAMIWSKNEACRYYGGYPADTCSGYIAPGDLSYGYYCVDGDSTKIEEKWFYGNGCSENEFKESYIHDCEFSEGCNCYTNNVCETVDTTMTYCGTNGTQFETGKDVIHECVVQMDTRSTISSCEDGELVLKYYTDSNTCSGEYLTTVYDNTCEEGSEVAFTNGC